MELQKYPQRENVQDCRDYLRTGKCKYGVQCKYNHPPNVQSGGGIKVPINPDEPMFPIRPNEPPCPYYVKHGTCKFGQTCKFHHPIELMKRNNEQVLPPQRPGEPDCDYFLRNGQCKFGSLCKYHHPLSVLGVNSRSSRKNPIQYQTVCPAVPDSQVFSTQSSTTSTAIPVQFVNSQSQTILLPNQAIYQSKIQQPTHILISDGPVALLVNNASNVVTSSPLLTSSDESHYGHTPPQLRSSSVSTCSNSSFERFDSLNSYSKSSFSSQNNVTPQPCALIDERINIELVRHSSTSTSSPSRPRKYYSNNYLDEKLTSQTSFSVEKPQRNLPMTSNSYGIYRNNLQFDQQQPLAVKRHQEYLNYSVPEHYNFTPNQRDQSNEWNSNLNGPSKTMQANRKQTFDDGFSQMTSTLLNILEAPKADERANNLVEEGMPKGISVSCAHDSSLGRNPKTRLSISPDNSYHAPPYSNSNTLSASLPTNYNLF